MALMTQAQLSSAGACECACVVWTHPQGLYDQVAGLQLSFHDTQQGEQLGLAQVIHVELTFLQDTGQKQRVRVRVIQHNRQFIFKVGLGIGT